MIDTSPCTLTLKRCEPDLTPANRDRHRQLEILDGVELADRLLVAGLEVARRKSHVALHPTCSTAKLGLIPTLQRVARRCAERVTVPIESGCCGFAGDRGFRLPQLTAAATAAQARELSHHEFDGYYSTSRTCEIGMERATGQRYESLWKLLDDASL